MRGLTIQYPRAGRAIVAAIALAVACPFLWPATAAAEGQGAVVPYVVVDGRAIPESLTGARGDPGRGRALFLDPLATGCTACHTLPAGAGTAGGYGTGGLGAGGLGSGGLGKDGGQAQAPRVPLDGVGSRLGEGELRLWLVDPSAADPGAAMPGYYLPGQRRALGDPLYNGPRLTAREIEDLVSWLVTLKASP